MSRQWRGQVFSGLNTVDEMINHVIEAPFIQCRLPVTKCGNTCFFIVVMSRFYKAFHDILMMMGRVFDRFFCHTAVPVHDADSRAVRTDQLNDEVMEQVSFSGIEPGHL